MEPAANLILIDKDVRRRASIVHLLSPARFHVEPFETIAEVARRWPHSGTILIHDTDGAVAELLTKMAGASEWFPIIAFSEEPSTERVVQAVLDGALEYVTLPFEPAEMERAIARATRRAAQKSSAKLRETAARSRIGKLTKREREVLSGVATGLSNRRIGEWLSISPRTVEIHRANMLGKLGAKHTSEAIRLAIEADLLG